MISRGTSVVRNLASSISLSNFSKVLLLVYILYLLFQLKSHAYMYESTPQAVIDEESYPGVLAEMLNSSSSSDSTSSSDTDTEASLRSSNTTRNRIKTAFRHRRRRKSNESSALEASAPSMFSSPSSEKKSAAFASDKPGTPYTEDQLDHTHRKRRGSVPGAAMSGDEADTDGENDHRSMAPRVRDFEMELGDGSKSPSIRRKQRKRSKKRNRKNGDHAEKQPQMIEKKSAPLELVPSIGVGNVDVVNCSPSAVTPSFKGPFARHQLIGKGAFRPPLPSLLSNNVFSMAPPPQVGTSQKGTLSIARGAGGLYAPGTSLRRASSLPDRLNRSNRTTATVPPTLYQRSSTFAINEADAIRKDKKGDDKKPVMSRTAAIMLLLVSTGLVAFCAELLVSSIPEMISNTTVSQAFIGLIILPIVGNAAEHVTAVTVATKNKMDLAIGVAVGSSIQIALFVTPFVVLLGWIMNKDMSLYFNLFETVSLFVTAFVVNFLVLDGRSNYLEGSLLIAAYVIIAVAAFFYPNLAEQSLLGGSMNQSASVSRLL